MRDRRIRDNQYEFPADREVSLDARELVQQILTPDPQQRPTLHEILDHAFFTQGTVPAYIPASAQDQPPDFRHISRAMSQANLSRLRKHALLDEDQVTGISVPNASTYSTSSKIKSGASSSMTVAQQEREFQKAVQPSSPISALLSSARQPLLVATAQREREQPLIRKLQAAAKDRDIQSRASARSTAASLAGSVGLTQGGLQDIREEDIMDEEEHNRKKELASQKARIVAQMVPGPVSSMATTTLHVLPEGSENVPPRREAKNKEVPKDSALRECATGSSFR